MARPVAPDASRTSASTVGRPRESHRRRASTLSIVLVLCVIQNDNYPLEPCKSRGAGIQPAAGFSPPYLSADGFEERTKGPLQAEACPTVRAPGTTRGKRYRDARARFGSGAGRRGARAPYRLRR